MIPRPPRSTRTDTLCPDTTLFRSAHRAGQWFPEAGPAGTAVELGLRGIEQITIRRAEKRARAVFAVERRGIGPLGALFAQDVELRGRQPRSEEHTSELQSLMRISYAVFCLNKKKTKQHLSHP